MTAEENKSPDQLCWECEQEYKELIAEQKKQLLSEKKTCKWFYNKGYGEGYDGDFEIGFADYWQIHISSMPEDIEKRKRSQKK